MSTIFELASEMYDALTRDTRNDGTEFVYLRDGSPEWMTDLCHHAHGDMLPDDWRYELIERAVGAIANAEDDTESAYDLFLEEEIDHLYSRLLDWVSSHSSRPCRVDDVVDNYGYDNFFSAVAMAQESELQEIAVLVWEFLQEMIEEMEEDE